MNGTELDAVIEQANRIFSRQYRPGDGAQQKAGPPTAEPKEADWPSDSLDAEQRFGQPHAKLFPFIGRKVRTPAGPGTLLQVFAQRVTVFLDSRLGTCAVFAPGAIEPVSWDSE